MTKKLPDDKPDFAALVPGVKRLHDDRINPHKQHQTKPVVRQNRIKPEITDFETLSFQQHLEIQESFFDHGIQKKLQRRIRQGLLPVNDFLDLHGYTQKSAGRALVTFLQESISVGHKMVIIIHGKGHRSQNTAVLKPMTLHWLSQQKSVLAWCPAQPKDGGHGASYVYLR